MTYYVLFGLFVITGLIFTGRYALQIHTQADIVASNKNAADLIPEKDKQYVLAPGEFIFNEIKHFKRIMNINRFTFFIESHQKERINFEQLIDSARYYKINYILFSDEFSSYFKLNENLTQLNKLKERIYLFGRTEQYIILKLVYD